MIIYGFLCQDWRPVCPNHGIEISSQTIEQMVDRIIQYPERTKMQILAPVISGRKGAHVKLLEDIQKQGYVRVRIDGEMRDLGEEIELEKNKKHNIEVVIDRIVVKEGIAARLADSLGAALRLGEGRCLSMSLARKSFSSVNITPVQLRFFNCELEPRMFSFNSPFGACPDCDGLGRS